MQLRLRPKNRNNIAAKSFIVKIVLSLVIFLLAIFLLDKINFPVPTKLIKQEISNDKIITLK
tara:strand:- start:1742 stop:1927 length:186 start_codon:yes stop_codon:yes gene_type:complete